ncbi:hypothetical protein F5148DRAFT_979244 [Russula earlei]|uniref:Uncharacterized protein n=1 Tax=Russula earlei TaxID=71964 RepID=A0ACC0UBI3_9AGAM|nr:hypothetical protein F5148DRAFT_979244 [Russula earlei]
MAYNREWDIGKEAWNEGGSWSGKGRDDDYGEGKKRKFNGGVVGLSSLLLLTSHWFLRCVSLQPWDDGGQDSHNSYQDYGVGGGGFHGHKKRLVASDPSPHVIFLGLDTGFTESDLYSFLTGQGCSIETVTIIRERSTGTCPSLASFLDSQSKGFGFAQFSSVETARAFVDPQFPFIQVPPPASHGASATNAFYKALKTGGQHSGRRVKIDYSQSANPNTGGRSGRLANANDGTRDIGNSPAGILLFRGLDPLSGPQAIELAMRTSSGPHKEGAKGMKRIILIKDKTTLASWGFAFVEFVDIQAASAVLAATMSPQIHPNGFRISDRPVATSFAHPYSFQPISDPIMRDEACLPSSMTLGGVEDQWVRYWDEGATIAKLEYEVEAPMQQSPPTKEKEKKKKKGPISFYTMLITSDFQASVMDVASAAPAEASALPVSDKPVTLSFKGGSKPTNLTSRVAGTPASSAAAAVSTLGFSMTEEGDPDLVEGDRTASNEDPKVAAAKKVAPLIASKKTANNISKWNQVQEVLSTGHPTSSTPEVIAPIKVATPEAKPTPSPATLPEEVEFEFSDLVKLACLLCARQFKSLDQLKKHNKESDLHKRNFKDANLREVARGKAKAARASAEADSAQASAPKYRDRASERRIMHNQPDVPLPDGVEDKRKQRRTAEGPTRPPTPPPPSVNPGQDESNVGNKLLRMMGWKEGTGLGVEGDGRVDPIQTAIYATGVGLGASKGKEVGKYQEGYTGYVNMVKDSVSRLCISCT